MNIADLASPGVIVGSQELRRLAARVISRSQIQNNASQKAGLSSFFKACAAATAGVAPTGLALVANGQALTVPVTGTYATKATVTVANGAVTAIVLG